MLSKFTAWSSVHQGVNFAQRLPAPAGLNSRVMNGKRFLPLNAVINRSMPHIVLPTTGV
jgi:hypothetical protein